MIRALWSAASGMGAQKLGLDCIANNLANVNTTGYKASRAEFQDLVYSTVIQSGYGMEGSARSGTGRPVPLQVGHGSLPVATTRDFRSGSFEETRNPLDLAIDGPGFFEVILPDGSRAYTRDGSLKLSGEGSIVTAGGYVLALDGRGDTEEIVPEDAREVFVTNDGTIWVLEDSGDEPEDVGRLALVSFLNPCGLEAQGNNLFRATSSSGEPREGAPGEEGLGRLLPGYLERSNVDTVSEMIALIVAQRAYEVNTRCIKAADEMLAAANDLRR